MSTSFWLHLAASMTVVEKARMQGVPDLCIAIGEAGREESVRLAAKLAEDYQIAYQEFMDANMPQKVD